MTPKRACATIDSIGLTSHAAHYISAEIKRFVPVGCTDALPPRLNVENLPSTMFVVSQNHKQHRSCCSGKRAYLVARRVNLWQFERMQICEATRDRCGHPNTCISFINCSSKVVGKQERLFREKCTHEINKKVSNMAKTVARLICCNYVVLCSRRRGTTLSRVRPTELKDS